MTIVTLVCMIYGVSALIKAIKRAAEQRRAAQAAYERQLAAFEREQMKIRREQEKHAAQLAKHNAQIAKQRQIAAEQAAKFSNQLMQAQEDIDNLAYRIEEAQKYSEFLENESDKCSVGGAEYFKWQNKLSANDNKIYNLNRRMNVATDKKRQAEMKLSA